MHIDELDLQEYVGEKLVARLTPGITDKAIAAWQVGLIATSHHLMLRRPYGSSRWQRRQRSLPSVLLLVQIAQRSIVDYPPCPLNLTFNFDAPKGPSS